MRKPSFILLVFFTLVTLQAQDSTTTAPIALNEVILQAKEIFGSKFQAQNRTGSSYYVSPKEIQRFGYTDVTRTLNNVPGVNIYEEDGFGLRPNISLRGTSPERSAKITLMEDGVLIAPAPYSAPAAYYFPTIARMQAVEILKGSSQIEYGPYTTGGAINMLSTEIPEDFGIMLNTSYGSFQSGRIHTQLGDGNDVFGYAVEYLNYNSNGFKDLDGGGNTGFDKNDFVAKLRFNPFVNARIKQQFELKFQYADETSQETYLGLSAADFEQTPFRRYAASQEDEMTTEHTQFMLTHQLDLSAGFRITTVAYRNDFSRNWYKLNDLTLNGQRVGIAGILEDPENFQEYYQIVSGSADSPENAIAVKANNRKYYAQGIQTKLDIHWQGKEAFHDFELGIRYHEDEEDRFQWVDNYTMTSGQIALSEAGIPGTDANRISDARAFAAFAQYRWVYKNLTLTPGVRYENIDLSRTNFGTSDTERTGTDLAFRNNQVDVFIPGIGFNYNFNRLSLFGGVHKGFSPPGNQEGEEAEQSINYELGSRFRWGAFGGELVGFYNDYSNLLGSDFAATGGTGNLDQFNAGAVRVSGLEVLLNYELLQENDAFALPLSFGYTFTDTEFLEAFDSNNGLWGEVNVGDELPYISKHQWHAGVNLEHRQFEINLNSRYIGAFRTQAGSGTIPDSALVDANFIIDLAGKYHFNENLSLTAQVINLLDNTYAVARVPAGLRPGHPFGIYGGIRLQY